MKRIMSLFVLFAFLLNTVMPSTALAQALNLPAPGTMVTLSAPFIPAHLKGMVINPNDPFKFDFIIYRGDEELPAELKQPTYTKLIKYFLAALAVPDTDQWVNLSPYEQNRIIPDDFGFTEMGRDLLGQDYILKQLAASLTAPDSDLGKKFWDRVYEAAWQKFGTTDIPTDIINKVWIVPDKAVVYEKGNTVYVLENHLKVMMEKDYLAMRNQGTGGAEQGEALPASELTQDIMREVIIPAIEKEVNEGKNFAQLRQVYSGMLLATWYKRALKESILGKLYADRGKVKGIDQDPKNNQEIYDQYVAAFKKGVFNMIKEDVDRYTQELIPRKYFSGGTVGYVKGVNVVKDINSAQKSVLSQAAIGMILVGALLTSPSLAAAQEAGRPALSGTQISAPTAQDKITDKQAAFVADLFFRLSLKNTTGNAALDELIDNMQIQAVKPGQPIGQNGFAGSFNRVVKFSGFTLIINGNQKPVIEYDPDKGDGIYFKEIATDTRAIYVKRQERLYTIIVKNGDVVQVLSTADRSPKPFITLPPGGKIEGVPEPGEFSLKALKYGKERAAISDGLENEQRYLRNHKFGGVTQEDLDTLRDMLDLLYRQSLVVLEKDVRLPKEDILANLEKLRKFTDDLVERSKGLWGPMDREDLMKLRDFTNKALEQMDKAMASDAAMRVRVRPGDNGPVGIYWPAGVQRKRVTLRSGRSDRTDLEGLFTEFDLVKQGDGFVMEKPGGIPIALNATAVYLEGASGLNGARRSMEAKIYVDERGQVQIKSDYKTMYLDVTVSNFDAAMVNAARDSQNRNAISGLREGLMGKQKIDINGLVRTNATIPQDVGYDFFSVESTRGNVLKGLDFVEKLTPSAKVYVPSSRGEKWVGLGTARYLASRDATAALHVFNLNGMNYPVLVTDAAMGQGLAGKIEPWMNAGDIFKVMLAEQKATQRPVSLSVALRGKQYELNVDGTKSVPLLLAEHMMEVEKKDSGLETMALFKNPDKKIETETRKVFAEEFARQLRPEGIADLRASGAWIDGGILYLASEQSVQFPDGFVFTSAQTGQQQYLVKGVDTMGRYDYGIPLPDAAMITSIKQAKDAVVALFQSQGKSEALRELEKVESTVDALSAFVRAKVEAETDKRFQLELSRMAFVLEEFRPDFELQQRMQRIQSYADLAMTNAARDSQNRNVISGLREGLLEKTKIDINGLVRTNAAIPQDAGYDFFSVESTRGNALKGLDFVEKLTPSAKVYVPTSKGEKWVGLGTARYLASRDATAALHVFNFNGMNYPVLVIKTDAAMNTAPLINGQWLIKPSVFNVDNMSNGVDNTFNLKPGQDVEFLVKLPAGMDRGKIESGNKQWYVKARDAQNNEITLATIDAGRDLADTQKFFTRVKVDVDGVVVAARPVKSARTNVVVLSADAAMLDSLLLNRLNYEMMSGSEGLTRALERHVSARKAVFDARRNGAGDIKVSGLMHEVEESYAAYQAAVRKENERLGREHHLARYKIFNDDIMISIALSAVDAQYLDDGTIHPYDMDAAMALNYSEGKDKLKELFQGNDEALRELEAAVKNIDGLIAFAQEKGESAEKELKQQLGELIWQLKKFQSRLDRESMLRPTVSYADLLKYDAAMNGFQKGGIDLNAASLDMQIKRDGNGVPLPVSQQDLDNIRIDGLVPVILDVKPAAGLPIFAELAAPGGGVSV